MITHIHVSIETNGTGKDREPHRKKDTDKTRTQKHKAMGFAQLLLPEVQRSSTCKHTHTKQARAQTDTATRAECKRMPDVQSYCTS